MLGFFFLGGVDRRQIRPVRIGLCVMSLMIAAIKEQRVLSTGNEIAGMKMC